MVAIIVVGSAWLNSAVFALVNSGYGYGYSYGYAGGYGYGYGYRFSDTIPSKPTNVAAQASSTSSVTVRW